MHTHIHFLQNGIEQERLGIEQKRLGIEQRDLE